MNIDKYLSSVMFSTIGSAGQGSNKITPLTTSIELKAQWIYFLFLNKWSNLFLNILSGIDCKLLCLIRLPNASSILIEWYDKSTLISKKIKIKSKNLPRTTNQNKMHFKIERSWIIRAIFKHFRCMRMCLLTIDWFSWGVLATRFLISCGRRNLSTSAPSLT